ncbi:MAG TPA: platelet-activating factor acetylhydrolase IB subunit [Phycisphaerae bacterium]|mgnify:CR=1 FL=1|jgi:beta-glucosidase|nr:GDSL family lipase [Phycisphaerae bacterium]HOB76366.1 platelet-activating factor acetylhydrolase IB subunit [Phycisphaerae bacterium]HOJ55386.1 platelet-activating factor acetylhydrolase IB subunit [Phycisphaerae bacterium]HOL24934.1 platelet-activating factor acetylhydrolase IB subunit [Phycisphaerae bacterium]HPP20036.1 platelet-activating factor acetylhydrolase IB subunit [Phycisphaerae bacterium]
MQKSWKSGLVVGAALIVLAGWAVQGGLGQVAAPPAQPAVKAAGENTAIVPVSRPEEWWNKRHESMNERVRQGNVDLIFIGDSITHGWEGAGKEVWAERYAKRNAVNLGISGDRTQHVLWRLDHGNIDGIQPKVAVVMIGTNNSNKEDHTVAQIAEGVTAIVKKLREKLPETKILLLGIFPRGAEPNNQRGKILQVNQILNKLADGRHVWFIDFGYKFVDAKGNIPKDIMPDYLHLTKEGYQIWADSIEGKLAELMGEK